MDSTRISLARILEADVPLTWQDAVAVVQEVAMVSDVNAAMNNSPSLVTAESCFLTTDGDIDLPDTSPDERPDAVTSLLRAMLRGRDAPPELQSLAQRRFADDLFGQLAAFSSGPRRPVIAALATRALAPPTAPPEPGPAAAVAAAATTPPFGAVADLPRAPQHPILPPFVATPRAVVLAPPFRAAGPALDPAAASVDAPDLELRRLRARTVGKEQGIGNWPAQVAAWLSWRPSFPDPRILGGAVIVVAALGSMVWRDAAPDAPRSASPSAVRTPAPAATAPAEPRSVTADAPTPVPPAVLPAPATPARRSTSGAVLTAPVTAVPPTPPRVATDARAPAESPAPLGAATPPPVPPPTASGATSIVVPALDPPAPRPLTRSAGREGARARTSYSAQDTDVVPPVMLRQQLPSPLLEPGAELQAAGPYLELLVDEQGAVEQVRLRARQPAPGQTWYRHRMLLAAAKAWQFEPARLDGQPVRYVMRVPLEP